MDPCFVIRLGLGVVGLFDSFSFVAFSLLFSYGFTTIIESSFSFISEFGACFYLGAELDY